MEKALTEIEKHKNANLDALRILGNIAVLDELSRKKLIEKFIEIHHEAVLDELSFNYDIAPRKW